MGVWQGWHGLWAAWRGGTGLGTGRGGLMIDRDGDTGGEGGRAEGDGRWGASGMLRMKGIRWEVVHGGGDGDGRHGCGRRCRGGGWLAVKWRAQRRGRWAARGSRSSEKMAEEGAKRGSMVDEEIRVTTERGDETGQRRGGRNRPLGLRPVGGGEEGRDGQRDVGGLARSVDQMVNMAGSRLAGPSDGAGGGDGSPEKREVGGWRVSMGFRMVEAAAIARRGSRVLVGMEVVVGSVGALRRWLWIGEDGGWS